MYNELLKQLAERFPLEKHEGDYVVDGLIICGKCHTPRQFIPEGLSFPVRIACECEKAAEERQKRKRAAIERKARIERNTMRCFQHPTQRMCTFERDDGGNPELMRLARRYAERFDDIKKQTAPRGLLLYGAPGTGKTYAALCVCNELLSRGYRCRALTLSRAVNDLQSSYEKNDILDELCGFDLVVLDDLGVQRDSAYMTETVCELIDALTVAKTPTIITSNLNSEELKKPKNESLERIYSRLFELCFPREVKGRDRRKVGAVEHFSQMRELLDVK